jgi:hypothetical protein
MFKQAMMIEEQRPVPELTRSSLVERLRGGITQVGKCFSTSIGS